MRREPALPRVKRAKEIACLSAVKPEHGNEDDVRSGHLRLCLLKRSLSFIFSNAHQRIDSLQIVIRRRSGYFTS